MKRDRDVIQILFAMMCPEAESMMDYTRRMVWKRWIESINGFDDDIQSLRNLLNRFPQKQIEDACAAALHSYDFSVDRVRRILLENPNLEGQTHFDF